MYFYKKCLFFKKWGVFIFYKIKTHNLFVLHKYLITNQIMKLTKNCHFIKNNYLKIIKRMN